MKLLTALFFAATLQAVAQSPQVPHKMHFADLTLTIRDDARREIQKDVDALTQSPKHFNIKVERAKTYFPIIEKIFAEENVPDDFKYLVIQESSLVPDAVSVSNAVGFWQFKDYTAIEMGLRVDKQIDERLNIASASRGAARYIKKNNFYFNNWLYALQAYQMGAGGVLKSVKEPQAGVRHMEITSNTYWYVKKFLAHKVAFEEAVKGRGQTELLAYQSKTKKTLADLAKEVSVDETELRNYNKWAKTGTVPDDRTYTIVIPIATGSSVNLSAMALSSSTLQTEAHKSTNPAPVKPSVQQGKKNKINGLATIQAEEGDTPAKLAERAGVNVSSFLKWNDISISSNIIPGEYYLLGKKRTTASTAYHRVKTGEDLWKISQHYAVQMKRLRKYNRLRSDEVTPGTTLWLASMRPKETTSTEPFGTVVEIDNSASFNWTGEVAAGTVIPSVPLTSEPNTTITPAVTREDTTVRNDVITPSSNQTADTLLISPAKTEHVVVAGETLYSIAKEYNVGVMDLVNWNKLDLQAGIKPGQVLKLSDNQEVANAVMVQVPKASVHEVKATDTLYSVARKYGVTIKELMEWNGKKDFSLSVGEKLKVTPP